MAKDQSKLNPETVVHVAKLARLQMTPQEITALSAQLSTVLTHFEKIAQLDTANVRPLVTPTDMAMMVRPDETARQAETDVILESAPEKSGRLFKVPPVV